MEPTIYFVIPCYNEEAVLPETTRRLAEKLQAMQSAGLIGKDSRVPLCGRRQQGQDLAADFPVPPGIPLGGRGEAGPQPGPPERPCSAA